MLDVTQSVTFVRILCCRFSLAHLANDFTGRWPSFFAAGVSDGIDGLLARRLNQFSQFGEKLDPIADKLMLVTSFIVLTISGRGYESNTTMADGNGDPARRCYFLTALIIMAVTGFNRFRPSFYGKVSTVIQIGAILIFVIFHAFDLRFGGFLLFSYLVTAFVTVFSGLHYVYHIRSLMAESRKNTHDSPESASTASRISMFVDRTPVAGSVERIIFSAEASELVLRVTVVPLLMSLALAYLLQPVVAFLITRSETMAIDHYNNAVGRGSDCFTGDLCVAAHRAHWRPPVRTSRGGFNRWPQR